MKMFGYTGNMLYVDLSIGRSKIERGNEALYKKYLGGVGLATRLLYDLTPPKLDPLSPDNVLVFALGAFAGTTVPTGSKHGIAAKSPLTGFIGDSLASSFWSQALRRAGYDVVVVKGRAEKPVYLFIDDNIVQFRDAKHLWGKGCLETDSLIKEEIGDEIVSVSAIGPAGENLVRFACITNDRTRQAGRTGLGAVMGSKNLKAIAVRGTKAVQVAKLDEVMELCLDLYEKCQGTATEKYRILGTPSNVLVLNRLAALPTKNWQQATFEAAEKVSGEYMLEHYVSRIAACSSCPIACEHICTVKEGPYAGSVAPIDYESLYALGPDCYIDYFPAIIKAAELCDHYGMDTISTGGVIAWAMECFEKGLLDKNDLDGLELNFGNHDAYIQVIHKIARREGIGKLLAEGVKRASETLGKGSEQFAMHIKGLELPGYDARGLKTTALGFAIATRGGCHNRSPSYELDVKGKVDRFKVAKGQGRLAMEQEDFAALFDSLILCKFIRGVFKDFYAEASKLYTLVTGIEMTPLELKKTGERICNLKKIFNIREGWTKKDDCLPPRVMKDPIPFGVAKGSYVTEEEFNFLLNDYYEARGWDDRGIPTKQKLIELELEDLGEDIGVH
jgi:aldehyde:ferredoxin oxidoreductase